MQRENSTAFTYAQPLPAAPLEETMRATPTSYLSIRNWEKYQHYKDKSPPWIKLYRSLLNDFSFSSLIDSEKWLFVGLLLLASESDNSLIEDISWIKRRLSITSKKIDKSSIDRLISLQLVERKAIPSQNSRQPLAGNQKKSSDSLAGNQKKSIPEAEAEAEAEKEAEKEIKAGSRARAHESQPPAAEKLSAYPLETIQEFVQEMKPHATKPDGLAIHLQRTGEDDLQIAGWLAEREEFEAQQRTQQHAARSQNAEAASALASQLLQQGGVRTLYESTELVMALDYFHGQCEDPVTGRDFNCTTFRQLKKLIPYALEMQRAAMAESDENGYLRCFAENLEAYANAARSSYEPEKAQSSAP